MSEPIWCVVPILAGPEMTEAAIGDLLAQSVPTRLLLVNQGVDDAFRDRLERIAEQESDRVFLWSHQPSLPSLSATWNRALDFVWGTGGEVALVVNNDVRLHPKTGEHIRDVLYASKALFVSAVGVTAPQFKEVTEGEYFAASLEHDDIQKGGPDFSCYLISRECHDQFRFDERFVPAFCEDLDYHRRLMLAGEGQRIFSVNLPYLHYASQTLKTLPEPEAQAVRARIESQSRRYYAEKWGGPVNAETFWRPFNRYLVTDDDGPISWEPEGSDLPTTPRLFDAVREQWAAPPRRALTMDDIAQATREWSDAHPQHPEGPLGQNSRPTESEG